MDYIDKNHSPGRDELVCTYYIEPGRGISFENACSQIAAESSVGTWTEVSTLTRRIARSRALVFGLYPKKGIAKISYPEELFEKGNISQILSSIAGNIFGMRAVNNLRLLDVEFPRNLAKSFPGPKTGLRDIRKMTKIKSRPISGTIFKPKVGLTPREMAELAFRIYSSGIDYSKDDENLGSLKFNRFEERVMLMTRIIDKIKSELGKNVVYAANITASADEMLKRADFVKRQGGNCIMIDIVTSGWSGIQFIRKQNYRMIIHGHRAGHAAFTRNPKHGVSMLAVSKFCRLAGVSALHTGTVVGKMEGSAEDVMNVDDFLRAKWFGMKEVMPIASGGLHPGLVPSLVKILGKDIIINFGGGLWGHPSGPEAGAKAIRQSIDSCMLGIQIREYANANWELREAINKWGCIN